VAEHSSVAADARHPLVAKPIAAFQPAEESKRSSEQRQPRPSIVRERREQRRDGSAIQSKR